MMNDEILERQQLLESNRYDDENTITRTAISTLIAAPLIDSFAINARATGTWNKFYGAINTGIYNNNTALGGSFLGDKYAKIFKIKEGTRQIFGEKLSFNYLTKDMIGKSSGFNLDREVAENIIETGIGVSKNYSPFFKRMRDAGFSDFARIKADYNIKSHTRKTTNTLKNVFKNKNKSISLKNIDEFVKYAKPEDAKNILHNFFRQLDYKDLVSFQQDLNKAGIKVTISKLDDFIVGGAVNKAYVETISDEISEAVYKKFFTKNIAEKIIGSDTFMIMSGAGNLGGKIGFGANIAGAVIGGISSTHQEEMIQTHMNISSFNLIKGENQLNNRAIEATNVNNIRSYANDKDYHYILSSRNSAEEYRNNMGEIDIDRTKSKIDKFTIF